MQQHEGIALGGHRNGIGCIEQGDIPDRAFLQRLEHHGDGTRLARLEITHLHHDFATAAGVAHAFRHAISQHHALGNVSAGIGGFDGVGHVAANQRGRGRFLVQRQPGLAHHGRGKRLRLHRHGGETFDAAFLLGSQGHVQAFCRASFKLGKAPDQLVAHHNRFRLASDVFRIGRNLLAYRHVARVLPGLNLNGISRFLAQFDQAGQCLRHIDQALLHFKTCILNLCGSRR